MSLLEVRDLEVAFHTADGTVRAVDRVSFTIDGGQTLAVVGESGSGKSVTALTLLGLNRGAEVAGTVLFDGVDLLAMDDEAMRAVRGNQIAMVFQDPLSSLHPLYRVGWQIEEAILAHRDVPRQQARARAVELLDLVGIPEPARRVDDYPHQFSGGMRQRAMIAMALALDPRLLIADEPTTALDATVQAQILDLIRRLQGELGTALIIITHDLGIVADLADDVIVMYAGRVVERADRRTLYYHPHHPYTVGLLRSVPGSVARAARLQPIPGQPPSLIRLPSGCRFHPHCEFVMDRCVDHDPPELRVLGGLHHGSACWLPGEMVGTDDDTHRRRSAYAGAHRQTLVGSGSTAVP